MPTAAFCVPDEAHTPHERLQVVDLHSNPERFTGFSGEAAHAIWRAVYESNCFIKSSAWLQRTAAEEADEADDGEAFGDPAVGFLPWEAPMALGLGVEAEGEGTSGAAPVVSAQDAANMCLEERVVYRLLSGMQTSVSLHICNGWPTDRAAQSVLRAEAEGPLSPQRAFTPNLHEFLRRFSNETTGGQGGAWLRNLYFAYATVLRAVQRGQALWESYPFHAAPLESADAPGALSCRDAVRRLLAATAEACPADTAAFFDETQLFRGGDAQQVRRELQDHFRRVSRIMDCVGCLKCRLWGKLQVRGLATALRILTARPAELAPGSAAPLALVREDVVALFRTLERFSASIGYLRNFDMMNQGRAL